jgi:hypothetical protein
MSGAISTMAFKCSFCSRQFKNEVIRDKHAYEQVCYPAHKRTYCRLCAWKGRDIVDYQNHIMSRAHLSQIGRMDIAGINLELIEDSSRAKMRELMSKDPLYSECCELAKEDVKIFFNDGSIAKVEVNGTDLRDISMSPEDKQIEATEKANRANMSYQDLVAMARGSAHRTARQEKILDYLAKWDGIGPSEMAAKFRIILEKIGMDDADYLGMHIRTCDKLSLEARQIYGAYLDEFIRQLTGLVVKGEKTYRDMDLFAFVARLTK